MVLKAVRLFRRIYQTVIIRTKVRYLNSDAIQEHFTKWSDVHHINYEGFIIALKLTKLKNINIFETGTSAHGIDSTRLFDLIAYKYRGRLISVDINSQPRKSLKFQISRYTNLYVNDSVEFINNELPKLMPTIDFCYLDSWDVDWNNPIPSANHGLAEFEGIHPLLSKDSIVVIDDTPCDLAFVPVEYKKSAEEFLELHNYLPGKGALVIKAINDGSISDFEVLYHKYNLVLRKKI